MRTVPVVPVSGFQAGINFDARFRITGWRGIAFYLLGWAGEYNDDDDLIPDEENVVAVMVGDDRRHVVHKSDIAELEPGSYCPSCGQIGCNCGNL